MVLYSEDEVKINKKEVEARETRPTMVVVQYQFHGFTDLIPESPRKPPFSLCPKF
jgi:hypothetical protein